VADQQPPAEEQFPTIVPKAGAVLHFALMQMDEDQRLSITYTQASFAFPCSIEIGSIPTIFFERNLKGYFSLLPMALLCMRLHLHMICSPSAGCLTAFESQVAKERKHWRCYLAILEHMYVTQIHRSLTL